MTGDETGTATTWQGEPTVEYQSGPDAEVGGPDPAEAYGIGAFIAGRYRLVRRLGSGASAHVWVAHDETLGRDVAIKTLHRALGKGGAEHARLRREAHVLARLAHPRITGVLDLIEDAGPGGGHAPVLVTELLSGEDLATRLKRGALPPDEAVAVCAQLADALDAAHRAGVVHRDVKPANVMLTPTGVKLLDFGIARTAADSDLTGGSPIGTPACMAPEQWLGKRAEPATDIYGLGCVLYWCLAGHAPFADRVLPALGLAHLHLDPPPLPDVQRPEVEELYQACLAKDPALRPNAGQVAAVLTDFGAPPRQGTVISALPTRKWRATSPHAARALALVAGVSILLAAAVAIPGVVAADPPASQSTPSPAATSLHGGTSTQPRTTQPSQPAPTVSLATPSTAPAANRGGAPTSEAAAPHGKVQPRHIPPGHAKKH